MKSTEEHYRLINQLSECIYRWKHTDELNQSFFDEFIKEDVNNMELDYDDKIKVISALGTLFNTIRKYDKRDILDDAESESK